MKIVYNPSQLRREILRILILVVIFISSLANRAQAGLNMQMNVFRYHQFGYFFFPNVSTNGVLDLPYGTYCFTSYSWPTNGSMGLYQFDSTGFNALPTPGDAGYGNYDDMVHQLTNGTWFLYVTNTLTTNVYTFTVTANITSNDLPYVDITYPADGTTGVPNNATFTWQGGPTDYSDLFVSEGFNGDFLPITQTTWQPPTMPNGPQSFQPIYQSNSTTAVISSQPVNSASHPISSWVSSDFLQDYSTSQFTVGAVDGSGTAHILVAYYPFDSLSSSVLDGGMDVVGGNDMSFAASYGPEGGANLTSDSEAGIGAVQFNDGDGFSGGVLGWGQPTPSPLLNALAGSFTVSCWVKTTQNFGSSGQPAYTGAGIVCADVAGQANDTVPIALTGGAVAFNTGGNEDDTLTSQATVNDGNYHHIVVTRNQQTGQKIIYIDGQLDNFALGTTNLLDDPLKLSIGSLGDAGPQSG